MRHVRGLVAVVAATSWLVLLPTATVAAPPGTVTAHSSWSLRTHSHPHQPGPYAESGWAGEEGPCEIHLDGRLLYPSALDWFLCLWTPGRAPGQPEGVSGERPSALRPGQAAAGTEPTLASSAGSPGAFLAPSQTDPSAILQLTNARVYPNPFNPFVSDAIITFEISQEATVTVSIYDWAGNTVNFLQPGIFPPGSNEVRWGGQTRDGKKLGNGTYLLRINASTPSRQESVVLKSVVWND